MPTEEHTHRHQSDTLASTSKTSSRSDRAGKWTEDELVRLDKAHTSARVKLSQPGYKSKKRSVWDLVATTMKTRTADECRSTFDLRHTQAKASRRESAH